MLNIPLTEKQQILTDSFQRKHDYLRISLIDKCNLRCHYCMPNDLTSVYRNDQLMNPEEIFHIAEIFVKLGVNKIRLTGGEPLVRKDFKEILKMIGSLGIKLCLTTNGILIDRHIDDLEASGLKSTNVSLDTLRRDRYYSITQRDDFEKVIENINLLIHRNFHVKINVVVMKNINEDELNDFVELTENLPIHVRFIEFMPFDGNAWTSGKVVSYAEMLNRISVVYDLEKLEDPAHSTSKKYKVPGFKGSFAFITTMTTPFCSDCNRLRLTADGKMKNCLFSNNEVDLLGAYRMGQDLEMLIHKCVMNKKATLGGQTDPDHFENRSMILIGG